MPYPFLSDEWLREARAIREEQGGAVPTVAAAVKMNLVINEVPFGDGTIDAHLDTSSGALELDTGHLEGPDLTVTVDYATAKAILIEGNFQMGMQAFMAGKIRVEGDMSKLMALQAAPPDIDAADVAGRLRAITE
jgi:hypothetical protein